MRLVNGKENRLDKRLLHVPVNFYQMNKNQLTAPIILLDNRLINSLLRTLIMVNLGLTTHQKLY
jgi:hypothetical protein